MATNQELTALEKQIVVQLVTKLPSFIGSRCSLWY